MSKIQYLSFTLIYLAFFGVIGFAIWWTKNANCLWALLLFPSLKMNSGKETD